MRGRGEGLGAVVPAPWDLAAVEVDPADPAVDAVELHVVGLACEDSCTGSGEL